MSNKSRETYRLRPKERVNIFTRYNLQEEDFDEAMEEDEYRNNNGEKKNTRPKRNRKDKRTELEKDYEVDISEGDILS